MHGYRMATSRFTYIIFKLGSKNFTEEFTNNCLFRSHSRKDPSILSIECRGKNTQLTKVAKIEYVTHIHFSQV